MRTNLGGWVCTQRAGLLARCSGLQNLPRGFADPGSRGWRPARLGAAARRASLPPAPTIG